MCTLNIVLDDQLVVEAERSLKGLSLQAWLQQQVEALVNNSTSVKETAKPPKRIARVKRRAEHTPSDEQLEELFLDKPMPSIPDDVSWKVIIDSNIGKTIKPVEKWL